MATGMAGAFVFPRNPPSSLGQFFCKFFFLGVLGGHIGTPPIQNTSRPLLTKGDLGIGKVLLKLFLSHNPLKSQMLFHLNSLVWWSDFGLHKNERVCGDFW
jgi:hypothetical protein